MLGLKREIIKERDIVGDMWEEGTKEIWVGDTGGNADRCSSVLYWSVFANPLPEKVFTYDVISVHPMLLKKQQCHRKQQRRSKRP